jgi:hypothetical protein
MGSTKMVDLIRVIRKIYPDLKHLAKFFSSMRYLEGQNLICCLLEVLLGCDFANKNNPIEIPFWVMAVA